MYGHIDQAAQCLRQSARGGIGGHRHVGTCRAGLTAGRGGLPKSGIAPVFHLREFLGLDVDDRFGELLNLVVDGVRGSDVSHHDRALVMRDHDIEEGKAEWFRGSTHPGGFHLRIHHGHHVRAVHHVRTTHAVHHCHATHHRVHREGRGIRVPRFPPGRELGDFLVLPCGYGCGPARAGGVGGADCPRGGGSPAACADFGAGCDVYRSRHPP